MFDIGILVVILVEVAAAIVGVLKPRSIIILACLVREGKGGRPINLLQHGTRLSKENGVFVAMTLNVEMTDLRTLSFSFSF
jgi:hypothetical protein